TVDSVTLVHPVVIAHREGSGWQLARLVKPTQNRNKSTRSIAVRRIVISNGSFTVDKAQGEQKVDIPGKIDAFNTSLGFAYVPEHSTTVDVNSMSFTASNPALELRQMSGQVAVNQSDITITKFTMRTGESAIAVDGGIAGYKQPSPTLAMQVAMTPISLPEIHRIAPVVRDMDVKPTINVKLGGPTSRLATEASVTSEAVDASFTGTVSVTPGPDRVYSGQIAVHHLDLAPFLKNPEQKSDINVYAKIDLRGPSGFDTLRGSVSADAPKVATHGYVVEGIRANAKINGRTITFDTAELAYRSNTTAAGRVEFASDQRPETRFDLRGVVKDIGIAYLPKQTHMPPAETKLTANYHVNIVIPRKPGWHVDGDVTLAKSTVAGVTIGDGATASFLFEPNVTQYSADMNVLDVDLKRIGDQFNIMALQDPKYRTNLNGHVTAKVNGTAVETMSLSASGALTNSTLFGGTVPTLTFESTIANNDLHVKANGKIEHINPAHIAARPAFDGSITGDLDTDFTMRHLSRGTDLNSVDAYVLTELGPSHVGKYSFDRAYVEADYHNALVDVERIEVKGNDVDAQGNGTIALNDTDQSGFWLHADAAHLEQAGTLAGSSEQIDGAGTIDAIVTGNRKELVATGTLTGNGLKYRQYGALAANAKFTAKIPDLDAQRASVTADTNATFVDLPGFRVNELAVKADYANKEVKYDLTAKQPMRDLATQGTLLLHPDHSEVHLTQFKLTSQGMAWQTIDGHQPAIQWGNGLIIVKDLALTDAAARQQQLLVNGTFGKPGEQLTAELKGVNLGIVDAFLLRPPQLAGTIDAKAVVSGTSDAPVVDAGFAIRDGKFKNVPWQSFTGTAKYTPAGVALETTLKQSESQWLTAKGELPMSFLRGKKTGDRLDLHVDSSTIDLGLIQGFTTAVSGVKGALQAKVDLTGTSADPRVAGGVTIKDGAFKAEDTGVVYKSLNGTIAFEPDRVHIDNLYVLDNDNDSLSLTGDLGVTGFAVSNVNLGFYADNFKVLGNEMGDMHINSSLQLTGTLANPKLVGDLGVATGNIKLDPILARVNSAYSTSSVDITKAQGGSAAETRQGMLGNIELALHVTIPDDMVVKADDLKVGDAPIGLGKVNITLGGDLNVAAAPGKPITLVGDVNTVRGFYDYQGRRFTILRDGKVQFQGDPVDQLDPALDVKGERVIQAVTVHVNVRGRLRTPEIELTSTPPQEQADILALIIFNQPMNQLGEGQQLSLAQRAGSLAAGAVANQLTGSIANSLNLDQFEVNLSPESGSTAEVTIGQQLGQNLYVKVQQGIGNDTQTNFILEYEFNKWMRLQTNVLQGSGTQQQLFQRVKSTGADLVFTFQFK
ncbi:MAG TPA: translocation/assembly module TamB domain-containing protein, partial [Vicinamibacterales bacterium]|nr:translocation/assembly module TamB domain-containing protein [Vicinamibacterales bacterium]